MSGNGELVKMRITAYSNDRFSVEVGYIDLQINPSSLKFQKGLAYSGGRTVGTHTDAKNFNKATSTKLSISTIFDETGVLPLKKNQLNSTIPGVISHLEKIVYAVNSEIHRPNFLIVSWGSFVFKGQLTTLNYDYTLFRPDGSPLRVKVTISVEGYMDPLTEKKKAGLRSPDLTRVVTLCAGESIPMICEKIYGDATYCTDIAKINNLKGFRDVQPGTELVLPPIQRNG